MRKCYNVLNGCDASNEEVLNRKDNVLELFMRIKKGGVAAIPLTVNPWVS